MDYAEKAREFLVLQGKIINKRNEEDEREREREKKEDEETKKKIESFFEENMSTIIDKAIDTFMAEMSREDELPPYEFEWESPTSLYFGCSRTQYEEMMEERIKKELNKIITVDKIEVNVTIYSKINGCKKYSIDGLYGPNWEKIISVRISICF